MSDAMLLTLIVLYNVLLWVTAFLLFGTTGVLIVAIGSLMGLLVPSI